MSLSSNPQSFAGERKSVDAGLRTLLNANNLDSYVLPSALSVTVARSHKKSYATADTFSTDNNRTVGFRLKPGSDYIYGPDSFLTFKLAVSNLPKLNPAAGDPLEEKDTTASFLAATFGERGTAMNLFRSVRLTHSSGTEIEFNDSANLLAVIKQQFERSLDWRNSKGSAMYGPYVSSGSGNQDLSTGTPYGATLNHWGASVGRYVPFLKTSSPSDNSDGVDIAIPLSILSEMFNSDKLLPPYLLAGLRIELEIDAPWRSLVAYSAGSNVPGTGAPSVPAGLTAGVQPTITISKAEMYLDSHTLTDSVQKALARMSAMEGLDMHFPSYYHQNHVMASRQSTINITKALSRVESITLMPRDQAQTQETQATLAQESFKAVSPMPITSWQIAIGSMFFPSHPVNSLVQSYLISQQGLSVDNRITFREFAQDGMGIVRGQLERSQILNGSGIAISATRGATINVEGPDLNEKLIDVFVKHTRLVTVFLDNIVVRT